MIRIFLSRGYWEKLLYYNKLKLMDVYNYEVYRIRKLNKYFDDCRKFFSS